MEFIVILIVVFILFMVFATIVGFFWLLSVVFGWSWGADRAPSQASNNAESSITPSGSSSHEWIVELSEDRTFGEKVKPRVTSSAKSRSRRIQIRWEEDVGVLPGRYYRWNDDTFTDYGLRPRSSTRTTTNRLKQIIIKAFGYYSEESEVIISLYCRASNTTGHPIKICFLSVKADRNVFLNLNPDGLTGEQFLAHFEVRDGYRTTAKSGGVLSAVKPYESADSGSRPLAGSVETLSPEQFERHVGRLLSNWGYDVEYTQKTGDGGIDIFATNGEPIVGGRLVVQCKYYRPGNNVGEPAVRDLFGLVHDQRANKGILVTTSDFTPSARKFAEGKQIELINGTDLEKIVRKVSSQPNKEKKQAPKSNRRRA